MELKDIYKEIKKSYFKQSVLVTGTKNQNFDLTVFCWDKDIYVKLMRPEQVENLESMIGYMKGFSRRRKLLNIEYHIFFLDKSNNIKTKRIINL